MTLDKSLSLSFPEPDIALIMIDTPHRRVNLMSDRVLDELTAILDQLIARRELAAAVFASAKRGASFAVSDFLGQKTLIESGAEQLIERSQRAQRILSRLSSIPALTAAAIDGPCLGTGAQFACWCDIRVLSEASQTEIGFPEVTLGLVPGWGGTVRAPRLMGLTKAVEMLTSGQPADARTAQQWGLADAVVSREALVPAAIAQARAEIATQDYLARRETRRQAVSAARSEWDALAGTAGQRQLEAGSSPNPALSATWQLLLDSAQCDEQEACRRESVALSRLFGSPVHRALLNVVLLRDRTLGERNNGPSCEADSRINSVGIIGAGLMGMGIAAANLDISMPVVITDASAAALRNAKSCILQQTTCAAAQASPAEDGAEASGRLTVAPREVDVAACDLIIETVVETMDVKRRIYARLEPSLKPEAILVSNTSTLPITKLAERLERPERFCGLHFFNPIRHMELVEVIRGPRTSEATIATVAAYAEALGKLPIVVNDGPGFLVNRLLSAYLNEAHELLCSGVSIEDIDRAAESFGMHLGPIKVYDMVGLDTAFYAGMSMVEAFRDRLGLLPIVPKMFKLGRLGRKSGLGFYRYERPDGPPLPAPDVREVIDPYVRNRIEISLDEIQNRIFLAVLLEATRVLEEGVATDVRDIDTGIVFGLGFPRHRGGILFWGDTLGAARILQMTDPLQSLGARFQPPALLLDMTRQGRTFYDLGAEGISLAAQLGSAGSESR